MRQRDFLYSRWTRGFAVYSRILIFSFSAVLAGCANETTALPWSAPMAHLGVITYLDDEAALRDAGALEGERKTLATKVLSSLAFERVTGLPTDPARLLEAE